MEFKLLTARLTTSYSGHRYLIAGVGIFVSALIYYVVFRSQLPWPGYLFNLEWAHRSQLTDLTRGSYPSFAFALSMGLIAIAVLLRQRSYVITAILGIWAIGLLHEISMGSFALLDVLAGTLGAAIAMHIGLIATRKLLTASSNSLWPAFTNRLKLIVLMFMSVCFATGTSEYDERRTYNCLEYDVNGTCVNRSVRGIPVYLSYEDLRSAVKVTDPRELTSVSRIYLYNNYLFANELNEGIHIIDNSIPSSPKRIGFIEIPGNQDIAIKDNALYADSYIDLVTIDVSDIENVVEVARVESVFPYDSRQNIPDNIELTGQIDRTRGVVVGYR